MMISARRGTKGAAGRWSEVLAERRWSGPCCACWLPAIRWRRPRPSLGLSCRRARALLDEFQGRGGVSSETRLIVLAVLNAWV